jgi:hypothetical protein
MPVSRAQRRRSPRLQTQAQAQDNSVVAPRARKARSSRPRADQFCVYSTSTQNTETRVVAFITEYKPPHKLQLGYLYEGLEDMDLEEVIRCRETDTPELRHYVMFHDPSIHWKFAYSGPSSQSITQLMCVKWNGFLAFAALISWLSTATSF